LSEDLPGSWAKNHLHGASPCSPCRSWRCMDKARFAKAQVCARLDRVCALSDDSAPSLVHFLPILGLPLVRFRQARPLIESERECQNLRPEAGQTAWSCWWMDLNFPPCTLRCVALVASLVSPIVFSAPRHQHSICQSLHASVSPEKTSCTQNRHAGPLPTMCACQSSMTWRPSAMCHQGEDNWRVIC
jgi:hypothetical protein